MTPMAFAAPFAANAYGQPETEYVTPSHEGCRSPAVPTPLSEDLSRRSPIGVGS